MFENFCSDIIQTMKCFDLGSFNLSCQAEYTKINSRLNFNPGLALIAFWTTHPRWERKGEGERQWREGKRREGREEKRREGTEEKGREGREGREA